MSTSSPRSIQKPVHWVLDWDGTITRRDTLDALVSIAASSKPEDTIPEYWRNVSQAYLDDYTETIARLTPAGQFPTEISKEKELLMQLKDVEQRSLDRVSDSGIFAGLTRRHIVDGAEQAIASQQVQLREGFDVFQKIIRTRQVQCNDKLSLLSVNWSRQFIAASLRASHVDMDINYISSNELDGINNDLPSKGVITAAQDQTIISSGDKLRELERIRRANEAAGGPSYIVYVGDSWTDIECLLAADLGIAIRDDPIRSSQKQLAEALERLNVASPHISHEGAADGRNVVWAKDFGQISTWIESGFHHDTTC